MNLHNELLPAGHVNAARVNVVLLGGYVGDTAEIKLDAVVVVWYRIEVTILISVDRLKRRYECG